MNKAYIRAGVICILVISGCANQALKPDKKAHTMYTVTITTITEKGGRVDWSHALSLPSLDNPWVTAAKDDQSLTFLYRRGSLVLP